jgi:hypothetical protein
MASYISTVPVLVIVLFIAGFLYSIAFIANPAKQAALNAGMGSDSAKNIQFGIFGFYIIYLAYVSLLSVKGVFADNAVPPKMLVFATLPLAIILFVVVGNTRLFKTLLRSITLESLIALHVFRLLGAFFIMLYFYHLLPARFAFSAGMGDIITAIFALPVAKMVSRGKPGSIRAAYAWNIFGILDIVTLLVIAVITAIKSVTSGEQGILLEMNIFPFVWFPAFAPATILFLHTVIFRKLRQMQALR